MESNDSPETPEREETSDIPGLPSGSVNERDTFTLCIGNMNARKSPTLHISIDENERMLKKPLGPSKTSTPWNIPHVKSDDDK